MEGTAAGHELQEKTGAQLKPWVENKDGGGHPRPLRDYTLRIENQWVEG